jgi:hypothetical protein
MAAAVVLLALLSCCGSTAREIRSNRSYELGKESTARVGGPMLVLEEGTVEKKRRWVGILRSPDGYETIGTTYSDDFRRKELIYQGGAGSRIEVAYRVFRAGSALPELQERLTFDLSESGAILVKEFRLKVLAADKDSIRYIVTGD